MDRGARQLDKDITRLVILLVLMFTLWVGLVLFGCRLPAYSPQAYCPPAPTCYIVQDQPHCHAPPFRYVPYHRTRMPLLEVPSTVPFTPLGDYYQE